MAITSSAHEVLNDIPAASPEDCTGRLWDVLTIAALAARSAGGHDWITLETRGRGDNTMTTSIPPGCTVVWDGPHSYLEPDLAAIAALEDPAAAQRAAIEGARERLQDLISYTSRARTAGSAEAARLQREPAQVLAAVENYATNVLDLLHYAAPAD